MYSSLSLCSPPKEYSAKAAALVSTSTAKGAQELRAYGSGLLSSYGELEYSLVSPEVQRYPVQLEWAINQSFEIHHYQPLLFIIDSFDHLFSLVDQLERWVKEGKLDNVAPGDPGVSEEDIDSFLQAHR